MPFRFNPVTGNPDWSDEGTLPVPDTTSIVKGSVDNSKQVRLEVDGLTASTVRVITMPDKDITLDDDGDSRPPLNHASDHTDSTDDIQSATNAQKGVATSAHISAIEANTAKVTNATHTGEVTGSGALTITNKAVTLAKMNDMATASLLGRNTAATGVPEVLSKTTALSLLNVVDGATKYPDTGEQAFLDADHTKLNGIESTADVTDAINVGSSIHGVANKATPVNADKVPLIDTEAANVLKTSTWTNIKAFLKTYFDGLYAGDGANSDITSMTALDNDGIPVAKVSGAIETAALAAAVITDHRLVRGDGGSRGVQETTVIVDDNGRMINPSQSAFSAEITVKEENVTGDGTYWNSYDGASNWTERFDQGNDFDGDGTFTAPVTGKYQISFILSLKDCTDAVNVLRIYLTTSNKEYTPFRTNPVIPGDNWEFLNGTLLVDMDINDTFSFRMYAAGTTKTIDVELCTFMAAVLIC